MERSSPFHRHGAGDGNVIIAGPVLPPLAAGRQGHEQLGIAAIYRLFDQLSRKRKQSAIFCRIARRQQSACLAFSALLLSKD
jgi:hypothetical protein